jgi:hypothetical protein
LEHFAGMDIVVLHMEGFFALSLESLDGQVLFVIKLEDNKNLLLQKISSFVEIALEKYNLRKVSNYIKHEEIKCDKFNIQGSCCPVYLMIMSMLSLLVRYDMS